jgi:four helix bundle protein
MVVQEKSFSFALDVIRIHKILIQKKEFILSKQLLRSGTSVGAMIRESNYAESRADFIHKLSIAQKEINESIYWIELLYRSKYTDKHEYVLLSNKAKEILKLLTSIIKTSKARARSINH